MADAASAASIRADASSVSHDSTTSCFWPCALVACSSWRKHVTSGESTSPFHDPTGDLLVISLDESFVDAASSCTLPPLKQSCLAIVRKVAASSTNVPATSFGRARPHDSPEYQAIRCAHLNRKPLEFIDLPSNDFFALQEIELELLEKAKSASVEDETEDSLKLSEQAPRWTGLESHPTFSATHYRRRSRQ